MKLIDLPVLRQRYEAGEDGHIYSIHMRRRMAEGRDRDGYVTVQLSQGPSFGGVTKKWRVHKLIAVAYLPPQPAGQELRHLDGNKENNTPGNLAWGTQKDNAVDRDHHGRTARGEKNGGGGKLTTAQVAEIKRRLLNNEKQTYIAEEFGVSTGLINHIHHGRLWKEVLPA